MLKEGVGANGVVSVQNAEESRIGVCVVVVNAIKSNKQLVFSSRKKQHVCQVAVVHETGNRVRSLLPEGDSRLIASTYERIHQHRQDNDEQQHQYPQGTVPPTHSRTLRDSENSRDSSTHSER